MDQFEPNNVMSVFNYIKPDIQEMEVLIRNQVDSFHEDLGTALNLLLSSGGKRVRPTITILAGKCLNADHTKLITMAASIELLHTATLVHDDLIDGSLLRRGSPTLNSQWSAGATVLTGDFLFASAAKLASETKSNDIMQLFSETLRIIVNGEISQMFSKRCKPGLDEYYKRIYAKTASLFETSAKAGGIVSQVVESNDEKNGSTRIDVEILQALSDFGREIGMAFQIADDILDFTGDESVMGKPKGGDLRHGLITLPSELFFEKFPTHPIVKKILDNGCLKDEDEITNLINSINSSSVIEDSYKIADGFISKGVAALEKLPDSLERNLLFQLAQSQARRNQ